MKFVKLNNGIEMPMLGFGTYLAKDGNETTSAVKEALKVGYRHIDCAKIYNNEQSVGKGIKESGVPREDIFLVSKVWNTDQGYNSTKKAFSTSLEKLGTDYLDLYLIHWPKPLNSETWQAMEELYDEGKIKAIGVSNFLESHLKDLMKNCKITPMVNQIEYSPKLTQPELCKFCQDNKIQVEAWSPLMQGKIFEIELLKELAEKYKKSIAQVVLRWNIQMDVVTIPKSVTPERIAQNFNIFDFEISKEDMQKICSLNVGHRTGPDPNNFDF